MGICNCANTKCGCPQYQTDRDKRQTASTNYSINYRHIQARFGPMFIYVNLLVKYLT
jgi:hypothetical protein